MECGEETDALLSRLIWYLECSSPRIFGQGISHAPLTFSESKEEDEYVVVEKEDCGEVS